MDAISGPGSSTGKNCTFTAPSRKSKTVKEESISGKTSECRSKNASICSQGSDAEALCLKLTRSTEKEEQLAKFLNKESPQRKKEKNINKLGRNEKKKKNLRPPRSLTENEYIDIFNGVLHAAVEDTKDNESQRKMENKDEHWDKETDDMKNLNGNIDEKNKLLEPDDQACREKHELRAEELDVCNISVEDEICTIAHDGNGFGDDGSSIGYEVVDEWIDRPVSFQNGSRITPDVEARHTNSCLNRGPMKAARENKLMPKKLFPSAVEKTHHGSEAEKKVQSQRKLSQRTKLQQRKFDDERGAKLFKVSNVTEQEYSNIDQEEKGTWVQCCSENCCKWRYLDYLEDPQLVPDNWVCSMSQDREYNSCDIPEVKYDESEHIYTKFTTGSIVWAKVDGYPWWPAMVEIDPDYDTYFELQSETSMLPTQFHVSFFDDQVTRAWIKTSQLTPYNTGQIHGRKFSCGNHLYKREIEAAIKNAESALDLCLQDRIGIYGFEKRYKRRSRCSKHDDGSKTSTRKRQELKDHKKNSKSGTKMTSLSGVHQVEEGEGLDHNKQGNRLFGAKSEDVSFKSIHMNKALSTDSKKFKKLQYSEKAVLFEENVNSESKKIRKETTENERTDTTKDDNRPTQRDDEDANTMLVNTVNDPETNHNLDQKSGRIRQYLKRKQETSTLNDIDQPAEKNDFMHEENTANLISTKNMSQNNIDVNVQHLGVRVDINSSNALTETENTKHETTGSNFCQNVSDSVKQLKEKEQGRKNMRKRADDNPNIRSGFDETLSHHEGFNSSSSHPVNTLKKKKDKTVLEKKNAISAKSGKCNITSKDKYNSRKKVKGIFIKESVELYALPKQTVLMERVDSSQQKNMCKNHSEIENTKQINKKQVVSCTSLNEKGRKNNSTKRRHDNSHDEQNRAEKNASHDKKVKVKKSTLVCAMSKTNSAAFKRTVRTDRKVPVIMKMPTNSKKAKISLDNDQHIVPDIEMDISLTAHIESDSGQLGDEATIDSCDEENEIDLNLDYVKKGDNNNDDHSSLGLDIDDCEEPVVFENLKENQDIGRFAGKCCEHNSYSDPLELIED